MRPLLDFKILQGINSIFIVYGQSGSGKSFTLIGEEGHLGLFPMSLQYLLKQDNVQRIDIAAIEAYGVKAAKIGFYDLVHQLKEKEKAPKKYDAYNQKDNSRLTSDNAELMEITNDNCLSIITQLQEVSHMAPTLKNPHSSRGHTCYFARIKMKGLEDVYFIAVDLAGSEGQTALGTKDEFVAGLQLAMSKGKLKLSKKQKKGMEQMYKTRSLEAGCINNGLTQLQSIFGELIKKKISKAKGLGLRKVLSSFISLSSAYAVLFTLSASANNNKVTRATLNFAKQTQLVKVETKKAATKVDKDAIIKELNVLIDQLKDELKEKNVKIQQLQSQKAEDHFSDLLDVDDNGIDNKLIGRIETCRDQIQAAEEEEAKWTMDIDDAAMSGGNMSDDEIRAVFDEFDTDKGGSIDESELRAALRKLGRNLNEHEANKIFREIDVDGNGEIDFDEFKVMVGQSWFIESYHSKLALKTQRMLSMLKIDDYDVENELHDEQEDDDDDKSSDDDNNLQNNEEIEALKQQIAAQKEMELEKVQNLEKEIENLKMQSQNDKDKLQTEMNDKNEKLANEILSLKAAMDEKERVILDLKHENEVKSLKDENEALKENYDHEREENNAYKKLLEEVERLKEEKKRSENDIMELKKENNELKEAMDTMKNPDISIDDIDDDDDNNEADGGKKYKKLTTSSGSGAHDTNKSTNDLLEHDALNATGQNYIMEEAHDHRNQIDGSAGNCCSKFFSIFQTNTDNQAAKKPALYHNFE